VLRHQFENPIRRRDRRFVAPLGVLFARLDQALGDPLLAFRCRRQVERDSLDLIAQG
jgi:hypothetical protein